MCKRPLFCKETEGNCTKKYSNSKGAQHASSMQNNAAYVTIAPNIAGMPHSKSKQNTIEHNWYLNHLRNKINECVLI